MDANASYFTTKMCDISLCLEQNGNIGFRDTLSFAVVKTFNK